MPKNSPPKYCTDKSKNKAFIKLNGQKNYLPGKALSPESREAYARFETEWWQNYRQPNTEKIVPNPGRQEKITVNEVALQFLQYAESTKRTANFTDYRLAIMDFLVKHYGTTPADEFTPACLHLVREAIIQSRRFCRIGINDYTRRIVTLFRWGVSIGIVSPITAWGLSTVKPLEAGHPNTFDHPEREYAPDNVIIATLPLLPPTLQAMIKLQRLTAMRPSEVFNMKVGDIDRTSLPGVWLYRLASHKTQKKTRKKRVLPFNETEQALLAPYLEGRKGSEAVFSPRIAMKERYPNRSVSARIGGFYNKDSYRVAVLRAIEKHNRRCPELPIPEWTPYELRHSAASALSVELGGEAATAQLGHESPTTTAIYLHREHEKLVNIAKERMKHNPFEARV